MISSRIDCVSIFQVPILKSGTSKLQVPVLRFGTSIPSADL